VQLDLISTSISVARVLRDVGMQRAADHADRESEGWSDLAYGFLVDYVAANRGRAFMAEDVRSRAEAEGLPAPPDNRAWGSVISRAARRRIINRIGYGAQKSVSCHCSPKSIWVAK
jgi:hypothetical protein